MWCKFPVVVPAMADTLTRACRLSARIPVMKQSKLFFIMINFFIQCKVINKNDAILILI